MVLSCCLCRSCSAVSFSSSDGFGAVVIDGICRHAPPPPPVGLAAGLRLPAVCSSQPDKGSNSTSITAYLSSCVVQMSVQLPVGNLTSPSSYVNNTHMKLEPDLEAFMDDRLQQQQQP